MEKKPNVLFILSDQHQAKMMGYRNHRDVKTPSFDRMAAEGVTFDTAITQNAICTPSRVCWLSGQYCQNHGYYGLNGEMPDQLPSVLSHFKESGYTTGAIGKIHCPEYWLEDSCDAFNDTLTKNGQALKMGMPYQRYLKMRGVYDIYAAERAEYPKGQGEWGDEIDAAPTKLPYDCTNEGFCVAQTKEYIDSVKDGEKPFFLHLSFDKPHQPYKPAQEFWDLYDDENLSLPPNTEYDMSQKAPHMREYAKKWARGKWAWYTPQTFEAARARKYHGYLASISQVDYSVGLILDYLKENDLEENTIVIYSTDHGEYACEHGMMEKAPGICSDAVTRIPMIWRWKNHFKAGIDVKEIAETVDMSATVCALTGVAPMVTSDGKDITPLLMGEHTEIHKVGFTEFPWSKSIRKGKYRFVYYLKEMFEDEYPDGFYELYDVESDPWEVHNLFFDPSYATLIQTLKNDLLEHIIANHRVKTVQHSFKPKPELAEQYRYRFECWCAKDGKISHDDLVSIPTKFFL